MAPSAPTSSSSRTPATTKPFPTRPRRRSLKATTRTRHLNNKKQNPPLPQTTTSPEISKIPEVSEEDSPSSSSSSSLSPSSELITADEPLPSSSCCSTPKGQKFRIPEIATCPPAPKKKKPVSLFSSNCSHRRSPIAFFAPPDLEHFFFLALPDNISV